MINIHSSVTNAHFFKYSGKELNRMYGQKSFPKQINGIGDYADAMQSLLYNGFNEKDYDSFPIVFSYKLY